MQSEVKATTMQPLVCIAGVSADLVVYVTNEEPASCGTTLASAGACE